MIFCKGPRQSGSRRTSPEGHRLALVTQAPLDQPREPICRSEVLQGRLARSYVCLMNWAAFDLNRLIVFDAVMQERSVTRAGSRIGLSQPAMSHALNRLRYMLKDELFVRTPKGMVPTPRAEMLAPPLSNALSEMQLALEPAAFDAAASDRCL